jgi:hypothetical protein
VPFVNIFLSETTLLNDGKKVFDFGADQIFNMTAITNHPIPSDERQIYIVLKLFISLKHSEKTGILYIQVKLTKISYIGIYLMFGLHSIPLYSGFGLDKNSLVCLVIFYQRNLLALPRNTICHFIFVLRQMGPML